MLQAQISCLEEHLSYYNNHYNLQQLHHIVVEVHHERLQLHPLFAHEYLRSPRSGHGITTPQIKNQSNLIIAFPLAITSGQTTKKHPLSRILLCNKAGGIIDLRYTQGWYR